MAVREGQGEARVRGLCTPSPLKAIAQLPEPPLITSGGMPAEVLLAAVWAHAHEVLASRPDEQYC